LFNVYLYPREVFPGAKYLMKRIEVLGADNGGYAVVGDLSLCGSSVSLFNLFFAPYQMNRETISGNKVGDG